MEKRRGKKFWEINFTLRFLNISLICATVFILISFYALGKIAIELQYSLTWRVHFIILQLSLTGVVFAFLIGMLLVLHRSLGAIPRIEKILEEVIIGNYSLRIAIRKKDIIHSFVEKLNKVLDILEGKAKT